MRKCSLYGLLPAKNWTSGCAVPMDLKPLGWQEGMASESDAEELGELEEEDYTVLHGLLCCMVLIALMIMH